MSDTEDFEEQLRQEELAKIRDKSSSFEHGRVRKDSDGTEFEWDADKNAWFPKIDDEFIAAYNMQYGGSEPTIEEKDTPVDIATNPDAYWKYYYDGKAPAQDDPNYAAWYSYYYGSSSSAKPASATDSGPETSDPAYPAWYYKQLYGVNPDEANPEYIEWAKSVRSASMADGESKDGDEDKEKASDGKDKDDSKEGEPNSKKKKPEPKWFDQENNDNTSVYIQGLPTDITENELQEIMSKCGLIAFDYEKKKQKLKLYTNKETGEPKGDGLCTYIKKESVDLAMQLLDESDLRGSKISLQPARFELKGQFDPKLRRKPKNNKAKRREKEKHEKLLDWRPDKLPDERFRSEKTVVLKNIFDPVEFDTNPTAIQEIREDLRQECSKYGEIKKLTIHDRNLEGVVTVTYKEFEEADLCIEALNQRWFASRRIMAFNWDGKQRFEVKETAEQEAERLKQWDEYLASGGDSSSAKNLPTESSGGNLDSGKNLPTEVSTDDNSAPCASATGDSGEDLSSDHKTLMDTDSTNGPSPVQDDVS